MTTQSQAPPLPNAPTIRIDLVGTAVKFLSDPSVAAAPLSRRLAFLEQKGLTAAEIDLALARVNETPTVKAPTQAQQVKPVQFNWRGLVIGGAATAATALLLYQHLDTIKVNTVLFNSLLNSIRIGSRPNYR